MPHANGNARLVCEAELEDTTLTSLKLSKNEWGIAANFKLGDGSQDILRLEVLRPV